MADATLSSDLFARIRFRGNPLAHPDAVVVRDSARFTILTPRLLRLEWSETGTFEDRGTYAFPTRHTDAPPAFGVREKEGVLIIDTGALSVHYGGGRFDADSLWITFDQGGSPVTWRPGMPNPQNLRGTRRTLDRCEGDAALEEGLFSRAGWTLFDDSAHVVFNIDDGWVAPRPDDDLQDWYFILAGHDYQGMLAEYTRFGGQIPLIPRFVLGAWWSRYWAYSAADLQELVEDFERYDLPLDVLVIDMDWHTPHAWTGYTWNRELFPDPAAFLSWVHRKGLRATLNLHPAQGVQHFEEIYPRFAEALGVDPESKEAVAFRITDKRFVDAYFRLIHHAMEDEGIDFWWMDWQQGESSEMRGLDPLPWINHLHFNDSKRRGRRGMLYSRWGGLGNHRYHIGFSGDTVVGWKALQFQPYFTATAANVAYGWWSHDIGGHMGGETPPELYARWVQFGAVSPCLRLHATKDPRCERRPWAYPDDVYRAAQDAFHLRYQLLPYFYTMARVASDTSLPLCRPMYYAFPEEDAAYAARYQYYLGDQAIAAPIVHPADSKTGLAAADVWLPEGTWIDYQTKESFVGPRWVRLVGDIARLPLLVKAGAILPMAASFHSDEPPLMSSGTSETIPYDEIVLSVFPGAEGAFRLYEDDGVTPAYRAGECEWTSIRTSVEDDQLWTVGISPVEGRCSVLPAARRYVIHLEGSRQPQAVTVDGEGTRDWTYNPETLTTTVYVPEHDKDQPLEVVAWNPHGISALGAALNRQVAGSDAWRLMGTDWTGDPGDIDAVLHTDRPGRADAVARLGGPFVRFVEFSTPEETAQQLGRVIVGAPAPGGEPYDLRVEMTLHRGGQAETFLTMVEQTTASQIIDTPFALGDQVQTMHWEARATITWRGERLSFAHHSELLFPTIYAWQALIYNHETDPLPLEQVMGADGQVDPDLDWETFNQALDALINVNQPHAAMIWQSHRSQIEAGEKLAAYLVTHVISPDDQQAVLRYRAGGPHTIYLNGRQVEVIPPEGDEARRPLFAQTSRTEVLDLRAGENTLLIATCPPETGRPIWFFGGAFISPHEDEVLTGLRFQ